MYWFKNWFLFGIALSLKMFERLLSRISGSRSLSGLDAQLRGKCKAASYIFLSSSTTLDGETWDIIARRRSTPKLPRLTLDALAKSGVELNRHYVHMMCTPSRASFQTGRLPIHVITQLSDPCDGNGAILATDGHCVPAEKGSLSNASSRQVGCWDGEPVSIPRGRGYDTSLNYFGHGNWMFTELEWQGSFNHRDGVQSTASLIFGILTSQPFT